MLACFFVLSIVRVFGFVCLFVSCSNYTELACLLACFFVLSIVRVFGFVCLFVSCSNYTELSCLLGCFSVLSLVRLFDFVCVYVFCSNCTLIQILYRYSRCYSKIIVQISERVFMNSKTGDFIDNRPSFVIHSAPEASFKNRVKYTETLRENLVKIVHEYHSVNISVGSTQRYKICTTIHYASLVYVLIVMNRNVKWQRMIVFSSCKRKAITFTGLDRP